MTIERYEEMLAAQGGVCGICSAPPKPNERLCIDHQHDVTGPDGELVIRGLLCRVCNIALGALGDSPASLCRAANYLLNHLMRTL